ncbi:unnamed protein product [Alopecurus aequalis]
MRRTTTKHSGPRRGSGEASRSGSEAVDRLSALPDALLHHIMSFLKAWEVVRTCVLARRWRHLWASAPCVDIRTCYSRRDGAPNEVCDFMNRFFLLRDVEAPVTTLRLRSSDEDDEDFDDDDANTWIMAALKRRARVVHVVGHRKFPALLAGVPFVSCHLKVLKLSYAMINDRILRQLSSACTSLEKLDLKDCLLTGLKLVAASLKTLIMLKCTINRDFSIDAPNLILLYLVTPSVRVPTFKNLGSLVNGTIILDDFFLSGDCGRTSDDDDDFGETTDDDDHNHDKIKNYKIGYGDGLPSKRYGLHGYKDKYGYGSDIDSDDDTCKYSEIANGYLGDGQNFSKEGNYCDYEGNSGCNDGTVLGGCNILHSLSSATSLELLADAGEVVLSRELKRCPTFINLKTLSLGEWCMATDFDALVFLLQHSPNIERLFLQLKLNFNTRERSKTGIELEDRSFTCKHVSIVKIKCSKDDVRVHMLAHLFMANGISIEKIYVRRSGSAYLRGQQFMRDLAKHELDFWGE